MSSNLLTAKHVDDINMAGTEGTTDKYGKCVEDTFGNCKLKQAHIRELCCDIYQGRGRMAMPLWKMKKISDLRPMQHPELTGADAEAQATKMVADMFVSLRGALACALITQIWSMA
eukprot:2911416-Pyramimonas_sp.AAC.1